MASVLRNSQSFLNVPNDYFSPVSRMSLYTHQNGTRRGAAARLAEGKHTAIAKALLRALSAAALSFRTKVSVPDI